jgi:hypothetical protein
VGEKNARYKIRLEKWISEDGSTGQAIVEFALVATVFFILLESLNSVA